MSDKNAKVALVTIVSTLLIFLVTYIYINTTVNQKKFKKELVSKIESVVPDSEVSIGSIKIKVRSSLKIRVKSLLVRNKITMAPISSVSEINIRVPLYSLIFGVGNIDVGLNRPQLFYKLYGNKKNWSQILQNLVDDRVNMPFILKKTKLSLRANDLLVEYSFSNKESGVVNVEKLIAKNINSMNHTAFEAVTSLKNDLFSAKALIVGSFNINQYLKENKLDVKTSMLLSEVRNNDWDIFVHNLRFATDVELNSEGKVSLKVKGEHESSKLSLMGSLTDDNITFDEINADVLLKDIIERYKYYPQAKISYTQKKDIKSKKLVLFTGEGLNTRLYDNDFNYSFDVKVLEDEISGKASFVKGEQGLGHYTFKGVRKEGAYEIYKSKFFLENLKLVRNHLNYRKNMFNNRLKLLKADVEFANCSLMGAPLSGTLRNLSLKEKILKFNEVALNIGTGSLSGIIQITKDRRGFDHFLDLTMKDIDLKPIYPSFLKSGTSLTGLLSGDVRGKVREESRIRYDLKTSLTVRNGKFENSRFNASISQLEKRLRTLKLFKKPLVNKINGEYDLIDVKAKLSDVQHFYDRALIVASGGKLIFEGNGIIDMESKGELSEVFVDIKDNEKLTQIPSPYTIVLKGNRYKLKVDYQRTMGNIINKVLIKGK